MPLSYCAFRLLRSESGWAALKAQAMSFSPSGNVISPNFMPSAKAGSSYWENGSCRGEKERCFSRKNLVNLSGEKLSMISCRMSRLALKVCGPLSAPFSNGYSLPRAPASLARLWRVFLESICRWQMARLARLWRVLPQAHNGPPAPCLQAR